MERYPLILRDADEFPTPDFDNLYLGTSSPSPAQPTRSLMQTCKCSCSSELECVATVLAPDCFFCRLSTSVLTVTAAIKVQARLYIIEILKMFSKKNCSLPRTMSSQPPWFLPLALQTLTGLSTRLPTTMKRHSQRRKRQVGSVVRVRFTRNLKYSFFQKGVVTFRMSSRPPPL